MPRFGSSPRPLLLLLLTLLAIVGGALSGVPAGAKPQTRSPDPEGTGSVSGVVSNESGTLLADICVWTFTFDAVGGGYDEGYDITDPTGSYLITGLLAGQYHMNFWDCGQSRQYAEEWYDDQESYQDSDPIPVAEGATTGGIDARLSVGGSISGTVTAGGEALAGICVQAWSRNDYGGSSFADGLGRYRIDALGEGEYQVRFEDCGDEPVYVEEWYDDAPSSSEAADVPVASGQETSGVDADLTVASTITGAVTDEDGAPLAEVCVFADGIDVGIWGDDRTDGTGSYRIGGLRAGAYRVSFEDCGGGAPEYLHEWYDDAASYAQADDVSVPEAAEVSGIDAKLAPGGSVSGTVTDEEGTPAASACVSAFDADGGWAGSDYTDEEGRYRVRRLQPGEVKLRYRPDCGDSGMLTEWYDDQPSRRDADPIAVAGGQETTGVDVQLSSGGSISGMVTNEAGQPLAGICVYAQSEDGDYASVETGPDGTYRAKGLLGGPHQVRFRDCDGLGYVSEWYEDASYETADPVPVRIGSDTAGIDAELSVGGTIAGLVTNSEGEPIANVCVDAYNDESYGYGDSDESGRYRIAGLDTGTYELHLADCQYPRIYASKSVPAIAVVRGSETPIDAQLSRFGRISGTVRNDAGQPLGAVCVSAREPDGDHAGGAETSGSGRYTISVGPGQYALGFDDCNDGGYAAEWFNDKPDRETADLVTVTEDGEITGIDAALSAGGGIAGTVTDEPGEPIPYPCVEAWDTAGEFVDETRGDESGAYRLGGLTGGLYKVRFWECVQSAGHAPEWHSDKPTMESADPVLVTEGQDAVVDASLGNGGSVSGWVTDAAGQPLSGVNVDVYGPAGYAYSVTDNSGSYRVAGLPSGEYEVAVYSCDIAPTCVDEVYDDQHYGTGTPVPVVSGTETGGIDVVLEFPAVLVVRDGPLSVEEGGAGASYAVSLGARPEADVRVSLLADADLEISPAELTFTTSDWNAPRTVAVSAVDDDDREGRQTTRIRHLAESADPSYDGILAPKLTVDIADNDRFDPTLTYDGPFGAVRGSTATLTATLTGDGSGVPGRTLTFSLPGFEASAVTDEAGKASVQLPVSHAYGRHRLEVSYAGDELSHPASLETDFDVVFEHAFTDAGATVFLNTITKELKFEAPGDVGGVKQVPDMTVDTLASGHTVVSVRYSDGDLTLVGEFELDTGSFAAVVKTAQSQYVLGRPPGEAHGSLGLDGLSGVLPER